MTKEIADDKFYNNSLKFDSEKNDFNYYTEKPKIVKKKVFFSFQVAVTII
jgi:hypothetical protein